MTLREEILTCEPTDAETVRPTKPRGAFGDEAALNKRVVENTAFGLEQGFVPRAECCHQSMPVLLTNASSLLSGDQDGTLIVPWPP